MPNPYRYQSPDARLRHIKYATERELERKDELDEQDNQRLQGIQGEMETEQARAADLDQQDSVQGQMQAEEARKADLDKREEEIPLGGGIFLQPGETMPPMTSAESRFFEVPDPSPFGGPPFAESELGHAQRQWELQQGKSLTPEEIESLRPRDTGIFGDILGAGKSVLGWAGQFMRDPSEIAAEAYSAIPGALGQGGPSAAQSSFAARADVAVPPGPFESLIGPTALDAIEQEFGPNVRREIEFLFSPAGALTAALFPAGMAGGAVTGVAAAETARQLGASEEVQVALQGLGNIVGGAGAETLVRTPTGARGVRAVTEAVPEPRPRGLGPEDIDIAGTRFADVAEQGRAVDIAAGTRGTPGELRTMVEEAATYGTKPRVAPAAAGLPQADLVAGGALARLTNIIKQTKPLRGEAEEFKTAALRRKTAALSDVQAGRGGEAGFYAGRGTLRGPNLPTPEGKAVRGQFSQQEIDALVNHPLTQPAATARPLEAANAQAALLDTLSGQLPTKGQIALLEQYFGTEFAQAVRSNLSLGRKGWETAVDLYHLPRTVMASIDNSFPLRQGVMTMPRHPKEWFGNLPESFRSGFSPKRAQLMDDAMRTDATVIQTGSGPRTVSELAEEGGLFRARIEGAVMSEREEFFQSNLAKRIPFVGAGVRWSERAYVTYGNKLRHDIFKNTLLSWQKSGGAVPGVGTGAVQITPKKVRALANLINRMTGRGTLGPLNQYGPELAAGFFAPKFAVSRPQAFLQLFNWQNPEVARMAASEIVSFVALGTSILSLMELSGAADVELDPRSADFGKIKLGDTRIDFWGGNIQWARLVAQMQQGKRVSSDGIIVDNARVESALRSIRYKAHPSPGTGVDLLLGETAIGEKFPPTGAADIGEAVFERIAPMAIQDLKEAIEEHGMNGFLFGAPAFGGVGVQTYETKQEAFERVTGQKWSETPRFRRDELIAANTELQQFVGGEPTAGEEIREDRGAELLPLAQAVLAGTPGAAANYHENRSGIMTKFAGVSENEFGDIDIPIVGKDMEILDQYYSVDFLTDWDGNGVPGDDEDTRMALEQQDKFLQQLSPDIRAAMKNPANFFPQAEVQGAEERRNDALEKLRHLFDEIPKYSKETVEGSEKIDDFVRYVRQQQDEGIHEHGEERWGWSLPKLAIQLGEERGDRALGQAASWALSRNIKWNDEYNDYLIENQEVIAPFFPRMYQRTIFRSPGVLSDEIWKEVNLPQQAPGVPTMPEALGAFKS